MQDNLPVIRKAGPDDLMQLHGLSGVFHAQRQDGYLELCLELQAEGHLDFYILEDQTRIIGYCLLNWLPKYRPFNSQGIPEIQDLAVIPEYRQKGLAGRLIAHCEKQAQDRQKTHMGIGVGLVASYGPAQRLYFKHGYQPDGFGAVYDRHHVGFGEMRPVDDDLCLMLVKKLA